MNRYLARPVAPADVVWSYAGVRPLYDDGSANPSAITRDYTLRLDDDAGIAPVLSVFGGKITTYRKLAEHALDKLAPWFPAHESGVDRRLALAGRRLRTQRIRTQFANVDCSATCPGCRTTSRRALAGWHARSRMFCST